MKRRLIPLLAACLLLARTETDAGEGFTLLSRSLIEGPARSAVFFRDDVILATGGGIAIMKPGERAAEATFLPLAGKPYDIAIGSNAAYVAAMNGGFIAIDLTDPRNPSATFQMRTPQAQSCALASNFAFVADFRSRLYTFDVTAPHRPVFKEMKKLPFVPVCVRGEKNILAIIYQKGVELHRVFPDGTAELLSSVQSDVDITKGLLGGGVLYLVTTKREVKCWNVSDPKKPALISPIAVKGVIDVALDQPGNERGYLLTNNRTIVPFEAVRGTSALGGSSIQIKTGKAFGLSGVPVATALRNSPENAPGPPPNDRFRNPPEFAVGLSGGHFFTLAPFEGLRIYAREREGPKLIGRIPTRGFAVDCIAAGDLVLVANNYDGVRIGRLDERGAVTWIGHTQTSEARDLSLEGTTLFVADGIGGLRVLDVKDPASPRIVGNLSSPLHSSALAISGGRAYIAGGMQGVEIIDVTNPRKPGTIWRRDFSEVRGIDTDGRHLFFADGANGLQIYSIKKGNPSFVSSLDTPGWNCDVFLSNGTAYLADGQSGVMIADVRDPQHPKALGSLSLSVITRQVHLRGATLFAAAHTAGIAAIDVSKPSSPAIASRFETVDDGRGVFADARFVYIASGEGGLYIFRYRN